MAEGRVSKLKPIGNSKVEEAEQATSMAASPLSSKTTHHVRSHSAPLELHPLVSQVDERLCRLRDSPISQKLSDLQDLFDCIEKMLLLPIAQRAVVEDGHHELLEGSLKLLDLCDAAKDAVLQTKGFTHQLQSVLRRNKASQMGLTSEIRRCLASRKSIKKAALKVLKEIKTKNVENRHENAAATVGLLKEAEAVAVEAVKSVLSFVSGSELPSKRSSWGLVSKIVRSKRVVCDNEEADVNKVDTIHSTLNSMATNQKMMKPDFSVQIQNLQISLGKMETKIQDIEEDLDSLYRRLIKTRVSLLNIFNN